MPTLLLCFFLAASGSARAQSNAPSANALTAQQDHARMMKLLGITSLRPGRSGRDPKDPNYANYDEAKANPYPTLPDPLKLKNGEKVTTPEEWWKKRRPEIVEDFDREIYGRVPENVPKVHWKLTGIELQTNGGITVLTKKLAGEVDNSAYPQAKVNINLTLSTPAEATSPVPVVMQLMFDFGALNRRPGATNFPPRALPAGVTNWQELVLKRGWGYARIIPTSIQPDNGAGLTEGIIGLCNKGQPRKLDDWGALRAWAWGASRALDYFETDKAVNAKRVAIEGHSRYGKAVLVAMAYDDRFATAYVSSSGEGGAKLHRRDWGEIVENVAGAGEYHWMAGNFLKYAGPLHWNDLPVDSHELIALCAPRPVFFSAGSTNGDAWVDAKGTFLAVAAAGPLYRLLGKKDLGTEDFPPITTALMDGDLAFCQHSAGHTDGPNWPVFLDFAQRYFNKPERKQ
ncbi:MAG TPA: acetylxylan esterase [Candidatus Dormibacteraeota bacterium]|nr:acetylxylan esterase [Candidatus Dormibacteraeota bacterium]